AQAEITMHADGATLFGFNHPLVQSVIQENTTISNLACTSKEWNDSHKMEIIFNQQIKKRKIATSPIVN
ncbi:19968_t:CDS:1, partial [Cetraspora pellucida]